MTDVYMAAGPGAGIDAHARGVPQQDIVKYMRAWLHIYVYAMQIYIYMATCICMPYKYMATYTCMSYVYGYLYL